MVAAKNSLFADTEDKLREKIANLYGNVAFFPQPKRRTDEATCRLLEKDLSAAENAVRAVLQTDLSPINNVLRSSKQEELRPVSKDEFDKKES